MSKILVVDDESSIRLLYSEELAEEGYEVAVAGNLLEAEQKLLQEEFDLMVLDIKLKEESGIDFLQKIVRERFNLPVILCTAYSCHKDDFSAWLADGYVVKSSDLQELKDEIRKVLDKKAQRQVLQ